MLQLGLISFQKSFSFSFLHELRQLLGFPSPRSHYYLVTVYLAVFLFRAFEVKSGRPKKTGEGSRGMEIEEKKWNERAMQAERRGEVICKQYLAPMKVF